MSEENLVGLTIMCVGLVILITMVVLEARRPAEPDVAALVASWREFLVQRRRDPVRSKLRLVEDPQFINGELNIMSRAATTAAAIGALLRLLQEEAEEERRRADAC